MDMTWILLIFRTLVKKLAKKNIYYNIPKIKEHKKKVMNRQFWIF